MIRIVTYFNFLYKYNKNVLFLNFQLSEELQSYIRHYMVITKYTSVRFVACFYQFLKANNSLTFVSACILFRNTGYNSEHWSYLGFGLPPRSKPELWVWLTMKVLPSSTFINPTYFPIYSIPPPGPMPTITGWLPWRFRWVHPWWIPLNSPSGFLVFCVLQSMHSTASNC